LFRREKERDRESERERERSGKDRPRLRAAKGIFLSGKRDGKKNRLGRLA
jgi:hypothetical protein